MEVETTLLKLILIICAALIIGILYYGINSISIYKFLKKSVSVILIISFAAWTVNLFMRSDSISNLLINWIRRLIT
jgi:uncharacterized membrane protein YwzB